jgi:hypothetical protein
VTTSSAEPARLEAYPHALSGADEELEALARELDGAMSAFASGAGAYLPAGFDMSAPGVEVRGLRDESRYQADWVARIGAGFRAADTDADGDGIFTADDGFLAGLVGPPTMAEAMRIPPPGTDPAAVARWWATLPLDLRERLIQRNFDQLGNLRGLPAVDTDRINRLRLARDIPALQTAYDDVSGRLADVEARIDACTGDVPDSLLEERGRLLNEQHRVWTELTNAQKIDAQMRDLDRRYGNDPATRPYLLTYGYENSGRFAVGLGNPDYADNTAVVVPGTTHDVQNEGGLFGPVSEGERLLAQMNAESGGNGSGPGATNNAVIIWMGTDMPDDIHAAANPTYGDIEHGAAWLRDDVAGYQAAHAQAQANTHMPANTHMTVVAHSYGSYLTGESLESGMHVDDFVSIGSAGLNVDRFEDLGMPGNHVWGGNADGDPVPWVSPHGLGPTFRGEATTFTTNGSHGHSEYYKENSDSLHNMARIAVGRYGDVSTRPQDQIPSNPF